MTLSGIPRADTSRAQSEVIGVALLTGVTVIVALSVGAVVITQTIGSDPGPTTDVVVGTSSENVTLAHNGGDSVLLADLTVRLQQGGTKTTFTPDSANATGSDGTLEPGERIRREHGVSAGDIEVLVVHEPSNTLLLDDRDRIPA